MDVDERRDGEDVCVALTGELDVATAPRLQRTLARLIAERLPAGYATALADGTTFGEALLEPSLMYAPLVAAVAKDAPPPDHPAVQTEASSEAPVFGVTMESTSQQGGNAVSVGNTLAPSAGSAATAASHRSARG